MYKYTSYLLFAFSFSFAVGNFLLFVHVRIGKSPGLVIKFDEINTRDEAEGLKGFLLMVPQSQRPELDNDENEFYASDLIGLEVKHDSTGQKIGKVKDMADLGAPNLLMEVEIAGKFKA